MNNKKLLTDQRIGKILPRHELKMIAAAGGDKNPPKLPPKGQPTVDPTTCQLWLQNCLAEATSQKDIDTCYYEYDNSACANI